ncbi:hypothetical protein Plhal304r1_c019g0067851 [Plasmopara halstedii]
MVFCLYIFIQLFIRNEDFFVVYFGSSFILHIVESDCIFMRSFVQRCPCDA